MRGELRGSEYGEGVLVLSPTRRGHLHFLLFSKTERANVYQDWNSWGYYSRTLAAKDAEGMKYEITRRPRRWFMNSPSVDIINRGDVLITDVYPCDGSWRVSPILPPLHTVRVQLTGKFVNSDSSSSMLHPLHVWVGSLETEPLVAVFDAPCITALNAQ